MSSLYPGSCDWEDSGQSSWAVGQGDGAKHLVVVVLVVTCYVQEGDKVSG